MRKPDAAAPTLDPATRPMPRRDAPVAAPVGWKPSPQQDAIWQSLAEDESHVIVEALAGCLSGDTIINVNRGGKGSRMRLDHLVMQLAGTPPMFTRTLYGHTIEQRMRPFNLNIPTYVARADRGVVRLARLARAWFSGEKETYTVTTDAGRSIRATDIHPFLTAADGWLSLGDLRPGMQVCVNSGRSAVQHDVKPQYRNVQTRFHPYQSKSTSNGVVYHRVPEHRAVVEAGINGMSMERFVTVIRDDPETAAKLAYLTPDVHVHHMDHDPLNNARSNLQVLSVREHTLTHGAGRHVLWQVGVEEIVSVEPYGVEPTYDIEVEDSPHNFLANGFVVHNTGKTTTMTEGLKRIRPGQSAAFVAFNKAIATELAAKVPRGVTACTLHSLGFAALRKEIGGSSIEVDSDRTLRLLPEGMRLGTKRTIARLVSLCKGNLINEPELEDILDLATDHDIDLGGDQRMIADRVTGVMERIRDDHGATVDFDDMIWLPVVWGLPLRPYDLLMVDELQDVNRAQQQLVERAGRRIVGVGDRNQAIYGFRGADVQAMNNLSRRLTGAERGLKTFPLTVTRRCPQSVTREARLIVSAFECEPDAPEGVVCRGVDGETGQPSVGELVLCRTNAPIIQLAYELIRASVPVKIQGRDFGTGLANLIGRLTEPHATCTQLLLKLAEYHSRESNKLGATGDSRAEARLQALADKVACIEALCDGLTTVSDVLQRVRVLFEDVAAGDHSRFVLLSSVHRAKGLEADVVRIIHPELLPHPMSRLPWQQDQEANLRYVAITRSRDVLHVH